MSDEQPTGAAPDAPDPTVAPDPRERRRAGRARHDLLVPALLAALVAALVGLGAPPSPSLCLLGDTRDYLRGAIAPALATAEFDAAPRTLGLGRAAIGDWGGLGEALLVGGQLCLRSTARGSPDYYRLVCGHRFRTSAFAYLPAGARPRGRFSVAEPITLGQLRRRLVGQYPSGVLLAGYLRFAVLDSFAVSRPAIDGLSVERHPADYYTEPREERRGTWGYVVGIAVRQPLPPEQRDDPSLTRLLAPRPGGRVDSPVQVLVLAAAPAERRRPPSPDAAVAVGRVMDESQLSEGALELYPLYRVADCDAAPVASDLPTPLVPDLSPDAATATAP